MGTTTHALTGLPQWLWLLLGALAAAVVLRTWTARRAGLAEIAWRPAELRDARLVFAERTFRYNGPPAIVARVDRVYQRPDGVYVLTELKRRPRPVSYPSDRIELSVQRLALSAATRAAVSPTGYIVVEDERRQRRALPVTLLSEEAVLALAARRRELISGAAIPARLNRKAACQDCAYRRDCRPTALR